MVESQTILPVTKFKRKLLEILKAMEEDYATVTVTRNGEPVGIMMTPDRYEALLETILKRILNPVGFTLMMRFGKTDVLSASLLRNIEEAKQKIASSKKNGC